MIISGEVEVSRGHRSGSCSFDRLFSNEITFFLFLSCVFSFPQRDHELMLSCSFLRRLFKRQCRRFILMLRRWRRRWRRWRRRKRVVLLEGMKDAYNNGSALPNRAGDCVVNVASMLNCASLDSCGVPKDTGGVQRRWKILIHQPASGGVMHMCTKKMNVSQVRCAKSGTGPL